MLLPKGGVTWKSTRARLPPSRAIVHFFTKSRFLLVLALVAIVIVLWRGITSSASEMQRYGVYWEHLPVFPEAEFLFACIQVLLLGPREGSRRDVVE